MSNDDELDRMHQAEQHAQRIDDLNQRLALLGQLLTCALGKLGGEMAVTTSEIERAIAGQQMSLTPLPHDRGYYVALVTYDPGGNNVVPTASVDVRNPRYPDS